MGMNIYFDKKNRTIYYSPITKKAYQVPPGDFKRFRMFKSRYMAVFAAFLILILIFGDMLGMSLWVPIVLTLVVWGLFEFFYYKFLNSLPLYKNFDKSRLRSSYDFPISNEERKKSWLRVVLYFVLGILLVVNAYQNDYGTAMLAACYAAMALCFFYGFFIIWQLGKAAKASSAPVRR